MSGIPPSKGDPSDNLSPQGRAAGRSNQNTPNSAQTDEERRTLLRQILTQQGSNSLESVATQPGMPERSAYPSHEAWLQAVLTASLRQSNDIHQLFGHSETTQDNQDDDQQANDDIDEAEGGGPDESKRDE